VPLDKALDWKATKAFCRAFAERMERLYPAAFTSNPLKAKRRGKIYLDYLRNDDTATAVAPYTVRARPGAPVSVPIGWEELKALKEPDAYTIRNLDERLAKGFRDPWARRGTIKQSLTAAMIKAVQKG
jgi:bifunctional non-homologous end joining protein LigD